MTPSAPPISTPHPHGAAPAVSVGLAVAALACGITGLCIPGLGLLGIILGIVALAKASSSPQTHGGKGMAIAGIVVGALSLFWIILSMGILLPALGKARQAARQAVSAANLKQIQMGLMTYAGDNAGAYPEANADWQARLTAYGLAPRDFISPRTGVNSAATDSYIYVPGFTTATIRNPAQAILVYENPRYLTRGPIVIGYADGRLETIALEDLQRTLDAAEMPASNGP